MHLRLASLRERLRGSLWFIPTLCVGAVSLLALATLQIDDAASETGRLGFTGSPAAASTVLSTIAGAIVTLTALVFSVTVVALQLASSQYSPRVLRSFLRDRRSQSVLGVFLATFAYAMLVLRSVRESFDGEDAFVPALSVHVAFALAGLSLAFFVLYVHHISQSMQASVIVANIAGETEAALRHLHPRAGEPVSHAVASGWEPAEAPRRVRWRRASGYLQALDEDLLVRCARDLDAIIRVVPAPGDFVAHDDTALEVWVDGDHDLQGVLDRVLTVGRERTLQQDIAFGFRQLVDIAERALSTGVNDPTTAVQAIDRLHQLLLLLAREPFPSPHRRDDEGNLRLVVHRPGWDDYVELAFSEIRQYCEGSSQVQRRLHAVLQALLDVAPPDRRPPLLLQLQLLERGIARGLADPEDRRLAFQGTLASIPDER